VGLARLRAEAHRALDGVAGKPAAGATGQRVLSEREMDVATRLARGLTNRQIARDLSLSEGTVRAHVGHILDKLDVRSRVQVGAWLQTEEVRRGSPRGSPVADRRR
jgi:DNA-binding NarL/FixJ family response regulator